jgi:hypothetical protein
VLAIDSAVGSSPAILRLQRHTYPAQCTGRNPPKGVRGMTQFIRLTPAPAKENSPLTERVTVNVAYIVQYHATVADGHTAESISSAGVMDRPHSIICLGTGEEITVLENMADIDRLIQNTARDSVLSST